jgi:hypothetical protein
MPDLVQAIEEALALHRQGRLDEAERIYGRVLKSMPDQFDALHLGAMLKLHLCLLKSLDYWRFYPSTHGRPQEAAPGRLTA